MRFSAFATVSGSAAMPDTTAVIDNKMPNNTLYNGIIGKIDGFSNMDKTPFNRTFFTGMQIKLAI